MSRRDRNRRDRNLPRFCRKVRGVNAPNPGGRRPTGSYCGTLSVS